MKRWPYILSYLILIGLIMFINTKFDEVNLEKDRLQMEVNLLNNQVDSYRPEQLVEASKYNANEKIINEIILNINTVTFIPRDETKDGEKFKEIFLDIYENQKKSIVDFFEDYDGYITYYRLDPIYKQMGNEIGYIYYIIDSYHNDFTMIQEETMRKDPFTGYIETYIYLTVDEVSKHILDIASVSSRIKFNSRTMYSSDEVTRAAVDYRFNTELPASEVSFSFKHDISGKPFVYRHVNEIKRYVDKQLEWDFIVKLN